MKISTWVFCWIFLLLLINNTFSQEIFPAVMQGDLDRVKTLIEEHPEWINVRSWGGYTPLHRASQFGQEEIVNLLVSKGADLEAKTELGMTPLYVSIYEQKLEIVKQLIDKGADIFTVRNDGETLLHIASAVGNKEIAKLLISKGLNINVSKRYGITPLHLASVFGHKEVVEVIISSGADVDAKNSNGSTALHLAAAAGETHIVALLKEKGAEDAPEEYIKISGEYLGQKKPGSIPELFAPNILFNTHRPHGGITFSPDGKEIYWVKALTYGAFQKIWMMHEVNDRWTPPKAAPFGDEYHFGWPTFSPDGKRLFVNIHKPVGDPQQQIDIDICFFEKTSQGWSEAINPGPPLNSNKNELSPSISRNGTIYFHSPNIEGGHGGPDIYRSKHTAGKYEQPENLGISINSESMEVSPCIAPDESYLLFSSMRSEGFGDFDLYISYKKKDGTWTKAKNLGEKINSSARDDAPVVSPDGKYLFFMSRRNGIGEFFWVDTKVIEELRPDILN